MMYALRNDSRNNCPSADLEAMDADFWEKGLNILKSVDRVRNIICSYNTEQRTLNVTVTSKTSNNRFEYWDCTLQVDNPSDYEKISKLYHVHADIYCNLLVKYLQSVSNDDHAQDTLSDLLYMKSIMNEYNKMVLYMSV